MEVRKFDIVLADFSPVVGSEQGGIRPAIVIQNNTGNYKSADTTIVLPMSSKLKKINQPTHTLIKQSVSTGLKVDSMVLAEQIRMISKKRIKCKIGAITDETEKKEVLIAFSNI